MKLKQGLKVLLWILLGWLFGAYINFLIKGNTKVENNSIVPKPEPGREVFIYDFHQHRWIYKDELPNRANGQFEPRMDNRNNEDIQEYLEDHIDGYKEKTYWGEEWDYDDLDEEDW